MVEIIQSLAPVLVPADMEDDRLPSTAPNNIMDNVLLFV